MTLHGLTEPSRGSDSDVAAEPAESLEQASLLRGRYALERLIEDDSVSRTYMSRDLALDRILAVTVLQHHVATTRDLADRFLDVERRAGALFHPNLVTIFDVGLSDGSCWSAHEYCGGGTLRQRLPSRQPIPAWQVISLLSQIGSALAALHRVGLVHGRVTPNSIRFDDAGAARLGGFGVAAIADWPGSPTPTTDSDAYLAPEQHQHALTGVAVDQYALALVGAELLAGSWHATSLSARDHGMDDLLSYLRKSRPDVSSGALTAISRALSVDPERRFASVEDFVLAFSGGTNAAAAAPASPVSHPVAPADVVPTEAGPSVSADTAPTRRWSKPSSGSQAIPALRARAGALTRHALISGSNVLSRAGSLSGRTVKSASAALSRVNHSGGNPAARAARNCEAFAYRVFEWFRRRHPADRLLIAASVAALILAIGIIVPLALFPPPSYAAPALEGGSADAARVLAAERGLGVALRHESSSTVPAGLVIRQDAPAGALVRSDRPIGLVVSSGPPPVPMPNILRRDLESARRELASVGLTLGAVSEYDTNRQAWGTITAQSVRSGRSVPPGTAIDVTIATPPWTNAPRLVDRGIGDVEKELDGRGLKLGDVRPQPHDGVRAGSVLAQDPPADTRLRQGSRVGVTIAVPVVDGRTSP